MNNFHVPNWDVDASGDVSARSFYLEPYIGSNARQNNLKKRTNSNRSRKSIVSNKVTVSSAKSDETITKRRKINNDAIVQANVGQNNSAFIQPKTKPISNNDSTTMNNLNNKNICKKSCDQLEKSKLSKNDIYKSLPIIYESSKFESLLLQNKKNLQKKILVKRRNDNLPLNFGSKFVQSEKGIKIVKLDNKIINRTKASTDVSKFKVKNKIRSKMVVKNDRISKTKEVCKLTSKAIARKNSFADLKPHMKAELFPRESSVLQGEQRESPQIRNCIAQNENALSDRMKRKVAILKDKLMNMREDTSKKAVVKKANEVSLRERMLLKLKAARFRYLNETIYTGDNNIVVELFKNNPEEFKEYHDGFRQQIAKWPLNPLDVIIKSIKNMPSHYEIADFGCGDARLAASLLHRVHSFDVLAMNNQITACDITNVPLESESVDVVVFCLSLMSTNLQDYIKEAHRVLKMKGIMKIAEVESRFENVEDFIRAIERMGFLLQWKDMKNDYIYFFDFQKQRAIKNKSVIISLKPCTYKSR